MRRPEVAAKIAKAMRGDSNPMKRPEVAAKSGRAKQAPVGSELKTIGRIIVKTESGWRHRSRIIAEQMLGRPLDPEEVVHHINGNKEDDRRENLQIFASQSAHMVGHGARKLALGQVKDGGFKMLNPHEE